MRADENFLFDCHSDRVISRDSRRNERMAAWHLYSLYTIFYISPVWIVLAVCYQLVNH